jgi:hypothetical protein
MTPCLRTGSENKKRWQRQGEEVMRLNARAAGVEEELGWGQGAMEKVSKN